MDILQKSKNNQRRIGLTGGIASGKTTITNYIRKHKNIPILDADNLSRELIKPNTYGYKKICDYFGNKIIDNNNNSKREINRKLLRNIIFKNSESKKWIEKLLHPLIKEKMIEECSQYANNQTILMVIPLLFEANFEDICTEIWLVKCPSELQKKRLIIRDKSRSRGLGDVYKRQGLTGGIASGKTTITNYIKKHKNIPILDAAVSYTHLTLPTMELV